MFLLNFNPILIAAAVIPAIVLMKYIYNKDKLEHEPSGLLRSLLLYGVISTLLAGVLEIIGSAILALFFEEGSLFYNVLMFFGVVGFAEEGSKYLVLKKRTWNEPAFNCTFDGVVYSVFVSLGFALWENISYVASYGFATAVVRAVTAIPGHASFGVFMGAYYGAAKYLEKQGKTEESKKMLKTAVVLPALIHGLYDFIATDTSDLSGIIFLVFIVMLFVSARNTVDKLSSGDQYMS